MKIDDTFFKIDGLIRDKNNKTVKISAYVISLSTYAVTVKVIFDPKVVKDVNRRSLQYPATIEGTTEIGEDIYITDFYPNNSKSHYSSRKIELIGEIGVFIKGVSLNKPIKIGQKINLNLYLPFSAINSSATSIEAGLSQIKIEEAEKVYMTWKDGDYNYTFYNQYKVEKSDEKEFITRAIKIQHKATLAISIFITKKLNYKEHLLEAILKVEKTFPLLGILGKRRLTWFEGTSVYIDKNVNEADLIKPYSLLSTKSDYELSWLEIPVTKQWLKKGLFSKLLKNLDLHPKNAAIIQAIEYLLSSYEEGYLFSQLTAAYTAFETLVTELGELQNIGSTMNDNEYNQLEKQIKLSIKSQFQDKNKRSDIYTKISELKRKTIKAKFFTLFNEKEIPLTRFMFKHTDWKNNMGALIDRRNELIHAGKINSDHIIDLNRLQLLLQLWILKLLNCPNEAINEHISNPLKFGQ